jgi:hypothetical protein
MSQTAQQTRAVQLRTLLAFSLATSLTYCSAAIEQAKALFKTYQFL